MDVLTLLEFKATLTAAKPPDGIPAPLAALWHDAKGDWEGSAPRRAGHRFGRRRLDSRLPAPQGRRRLERCVLVSACRESRWRAIAARGGVGGYRERAARIRRDLISVKRRNKRAPAAGGRRTTRSRRVSRVDDRAEARSHPLWGPCCGISGLDTAAGGAGGRRRRGHASGQEQAPRAGCRRLSRCRRHLVTPVGHRHRPQRTVERPHGAGRCLAAARSAPVPDGGPSRAAAGSCPRAVNRALRRVKPQCRRGRPAARAPCGRPRS